MKKIIVILGQTATGKSALAVEVAKKLNGEVISADSRQVYKGLDIGTGKITKKEMRGVPHHLLDIASPKLKFTVTQYQKKSLSAIALILKRGKIPILCGGTGFYIDAVTKGIVFPEVPPDSKLRKILEKKTAPELCQILRKLDPARAKNIKSKGEERNKVRLIRAIEIAKSLGRVPRLKNAASPYEFIKIGLCLPKERLKVKVEKRVRQMFKAGLHREIAKLKHSGISDKRLRELGFEYFEPTPEKVITGTIKYAKRQMTWFKRDKEIKWFDASTSASEIVSFLRNKMI